MYIVQLPCSRIQPDDGRFKRPKHVVVSSVQPHLLLSSFCCSLTASLPYILYWLTQRDVSPQSYNKKIFTGRAKPIRKTSGQISGISSFNNITAFSYLPIHIFTCYLITFSIFTHLIVMFLHLSDFREERKYRYN